MRDLPVIAVVTYHEIMDEDFTGIHVDIFEDEKFLENTPYRRMANFDIEQHQPIEETVYANQKERFRFKSSEDAILFYSNAGYRSTYYGIWDVVELDEAIKLYLSDEEVYRLYDDGSEGLVESLDDMKEHVEQGGELGVEPRDKTEGEE